MIGICGSRTVVVLQTPMSWLHNVRDRPKEHPPFYTDSSNFVAFTKYIGFQQLPKTFQDAIAVTGQLGVRYLWIDSFCIIQDDDKDWEAQSKLMENVFTSTYCTIAAIRARGSSDGFLKPKLPRLAVGVVRKAISITSANTLTTFTLTLRNRI